jgi:prolyl-tRNA synthetase
MKLSNYFWFANKDIKEEDTVISHKLSLKAGFIKMLSSGIYLWTPPGLKILKKIENIIRDEMNKANAQECLLSAIQPASLWKQSGRYDDYGLEMLRISDRHKQEMLFGPTHEEVMSFLIKSYIKSYKQLPKNLYQIQWKFRDEIRPRYGLMRGREFLMKDAYSFDISHEDAIKSYDIMYKTYYKIFKKLGLKAIAVSADTGPIGGDFSHEFQILTKNGEGTTYFDKKLLEKVQLDDFSSDEIKKFYCATDEIYEKDVINKKNFDNIEIVKSKTIEVGHIFIFDQKYSLPLDLCVQNSSNQLVHLYMGSYGIGVSRLFAAIIEASHDENGIIWPTQISPFKYAVLDNLKLDDCEIYDKFENAKIDFIYDDTSDSLGEKFNRFDLFGCPYQIILGNEYKNNKKIELKKRKTGERKYLDLELFLTNESESGDLFD